MHNTLKTVAEFKVQFLQFLDKYGKPTQALPECCKNKDIILPIYKMMLQTRAFDAKAIALQRTGKLGTYPSTLGQEAIATSVGSVMQAEDVLAPYYREYGAQFFSGVKMEEILLYWGGEETGSNFQNSNNDLPCCVPIASQTLHAVGVAMAFKLQKKPQAAVTFIGEGGTSRGDFYEAMNFAGVQKLPVLFVINNNKWAISVPAEKQTHCKTFAQKAIAAGIEHFMQVDGNDCLAMRYIADQALQRARAGEGPTVIEALSYRMCDHTTADDAKRYRSEQELKLHAQEDPINRMRLYLEDAGFWTAEDETQLHKEVKHNVSQAVENYLAAPKRSAQSMFDNLYAELPKVYESQYQDIIRHTKN